MSSEDDCPADRFVISRKQPDEILDEMVQVYREAYANYPQYAENSYQSIVNYFYSLLKVRPEGFLVVSQNKQIIAFAIEGFYQLNGERIGEIMEVVVSPRAKGKGTGKKILNYLMNILSKYGCEKVYLEVGRKNKIAFNLYEKLGFKSFRDDGKWIHMVKEDAENKTTHELPGELLPQQKE